MLVETYEVEEVAADHPEHNEEVVKIVESLGLDGQISMMTDPKSAATKVRAPYREVTLEEWFAIRMLCPTRIPIEKYDRAPIPLRVLQVAAFANETGAFDRLVIYCPRSLTDRDPFLIGEIGEPYSPKLFLLARWGDVLDEWPAVIKSAMQKWRDESARKLRGILTDAKNDLDRLEADGLTLEQAMNRLDGPSYYGLA